MYSSARFVILRQIDLNTKRGSFSHDRRCPIISSLPLSINHVTFASACEWSVISRTPLINTKTNSDNISSK